MSNDMFTGLGLGIAIGTIITKGVYIWRYRNYVPKEAATLTPTKQEADRSNAN